MKQRSQASAKVGARIRAAREAATITRADLAALSQLDLSHLARIENGNANPTLQTLLQVVVALDLNLADLVSGLDVNDLPAGVDSVSLAEAAREVRRQRHQSA